MTSEFSLEHLFVFRIKFCFLPVDNFSHFLNDTEAKQTHTFHSPCYTTPAYLRHIALMQHIRWNVRREVWIRIVHRPAASVPPRTCSQKCETVIKLSPFNKLANSWYLAEEGLWRWRAPPHGWSLYLDAATLITSGISRWLKPAAMLCGTVWLCQERQQVEWGQRVQRSKVRVTRDRLLLWSVRETWTDTSRGWFRCSWTPNVWILSG